MVVGGWGGGACRAYRHPRRRGASCSHGAAAANHAACDSPRPGAKHLAHPRPAAARAPGVGGLLRMRKFGIKRDGEQNTSLTLDKQRHVHPVWGVGDKPGDILELVAGGDASQIAGHDIMAGPTESAARFGSGGMLFASARLDNLSSVFAGLRGLLAASGASWDDDTGEAVQGLSVRLSAAAPGVDPMIPVFAA